MELSLSAQELKDEAMGDAAAPVLQRQDVMRSAVEKLYAADCSLQDAIDKARSIVGPAGHVSLSLGVKASFTSFTV